MSLGLYIHIPFCRRRCSYCDFYLTTNMNLINSFVNSAIKEIKLYSIQFHDDKVDTIYFGGGTPSSLKTEFLSDILSAIFNNFNVSKNPEITIECNPEDVIEDKQKFQIIAKTGINRISLGIQSFIDSELLYLTRHHNANDANNSIKILQDIFPNLSIDLIYAMHNQSAENVEYNIRNISRHDIKHVSAYTLILEKGTLMHKQMEKTDLIKQTNKNSEQYYFVISNLLESMGYRHYEVSNYSLPGFESRHNLKYWNFENYLGLGPSAHSFIGNKRFSNVSNLKLYNNFIENNKLPVENDILLNKIQLRNDYFISVFRSGGVEFSKYKRLFNEDFLLKYRKNTEELLNLRLANVSETHFYLTQKGFALADEITLKFVDYL
ncbi:MAG: radical SAM family heme chaperone HemW [Ignavibacteria bacterium]